MSFVINQPWPGQSSSGIPYNDTCLNTTSGPCLASIGEQAEVPSVSGAVVGSGSGYFCTERFGPEWEYIGDEDYNAAWLDIGKKCQRTSNTASVSDCCLGNKTGQLSCAKNTDISNQSVCSPQYASYCGQGTNVYSDSRCLQWVSMYPSDAAAVVAAAVAANPMSALGVAQIRDNCITSGKCDTGANTYCAKTNTSADAAFCSCINSTQLRPECFDTACTAGGYKTQSMMTGPQCGTLVQCIQNAPKTSGTGNTVTQNQQILNCEGGGSANTPVPPAPSTPTTTTSSGDIITNITNALGLGGTPTSSTPTSAPTSSNSYEIYGLIGVIFVVFMLLVVMMFRSGGEEKTQPQIIYMPAPPPGYPIR